MGLRVVRPGGYILIAMKDGYNSQSTRLVRWSSNISCSTTMAGSTCCASHSATAGQLGLPTTRRPPGGGTCEQLQLQQPQRQRNIGIFLQPPKLFFFSGINQAFL